MPVLMAATAASPGVRKSDVNPEPTARRNICRMRSSEGSPTRPRAGRAERRSGTGERRGYEGAGPMEGGDPWASLDREGAGPRGSLAVSGREWGEQGMPGRAWWEEGAMGGARPRVGGPWAGVGGV